MLYGEHALHQLRATQAKTGECVQGRATFTAAMKILQNDPKV